MTQYEIRAGDKFTIVIKAEDKEDESIPCTAESRWNEPEKLLLLVEFESVPTSVSEDPDWTTLKTRICVCPGDDGRSYVEEGQRVAFGWQSTRGPKKVEAGTLGGFAITSPVG